MADEGEVEKNEEQQTTYRDYGQENNLILPIESNWDDSTNSTQRNSGTGSLDEVKVNLKVV